MIRRRRHSSFPSPSLQVWPLLVWLCAAASFTVSGELTAQVRAFAGWNWTDGVTASRGTFRFLSNAPGGGRAGPADPVFGQDAVLRAYAEATQQFATGVPSQVSGFVQATATLTVGPKPTRVRVMVSLIGQLENEDDEGDASMVGSCVILGQGGVSTPVFRRTTDGTTPVASGPARKILLQPGVYTVQADLSVSASMTQDFAPGDRSISDAFNAPRSMWVRLRDCGLPPGFVGSVPFNTTNGIPVGADSDLSGNDIYFTDIGTADECGVADPQTGAIRSSTNVSVNSGNPLGVTSDGSNIYVTDTVGGDVDVYDTAFNYLSSFSVAANTTFPEGIAYNPNTGNLYVVNGDGGNDVLEYDTAGNLIGTYPINGSSQDGIAHDPCDDKFWVYDSGTDTIRHYDSSFVEQGASSGTLAAGLSAGEGVAVIGTDLYVIATGSDRIAHFSRTATPAAVTEYGSGCPATSGDPFYELFTAAGTNDLSGTAITLTPNAAGGYDVAAGGSFNPGFANDLLAGDDQLFPALPLGFAINVPGVGTVSTIDVDSNGRAGFGLTGSDFSESAAEFVVQNILAPNWDDLNPSAGGAVYFDTTATRALVTWDQVPQFGNTDSNTFQIQINDDSSIVLAWQQVADDALVGFSDASGTDNGSIDLSASIPFGTSGPARTFTLNSSARPVTGTSITLTAGPISGTAVASAVLIGAGQVSTPIPGTDGCVFLTTGDASVPLVGGSVVIAIPNSAVIIGTNAYAQAAVLDPAIPDPIPAYTSNGLELSIGDA